MRETAVTRETAKSFHCSVRHVSYLHSEPWLMFFGRGYILGALKSDLERPYSIPRLRQLMRSDGAMYFKIRERLQYVLEQNTRGTDP